MEKQLDVTEIPHGMVLHCLDELREMEVIVTAYNETRAYITIEYPDYKNDSVENIVRNLLGNKIWNTSSKPVRSFYITAMTAIGYADFSENSLIETPDGNYMGLNDWVEKVTKTTPIEMYDKWIDYYTTYDGVPKERLIRMWNDATDSIRFEMIDIFFFEIFRSIDKLFKTYHIRILDSDD